MRVQEVDFQVHAALANLITSGTQLQPFPYLECQSQLTIELYFKCFQLDNRVERKAFVNIEMKRPAIGLQRNYIIFL